MHRTRPSLALVILALALGGCGDGGEPVRERDGSFTVTLDEYFLRPQEIRVPKGRRLTVTAGARADMELSCVGDCDADGVVTAGELVTGVGIGLGRTRLERCLRLKSPTIDALVASVGNALGGCTNTRTHGFVGFERFDFLRSAAFGFCPVYGSVLAATLLRQENGRYLLKTTRRTAVSPAFAHERSDR